MDFNQSIFKIMIVLGSTWKFDNAPKTNTFQGRHYLDKEEVEDGDEDDEVEDKDGEVDGVDEEEDDGNSDIFLQ